MGGFGCLHNILGGIPRGYHGITVCFREKEGAATEAGRSLGLKVDRFCQVKALGFHLIGPRR